VIAEVARQIEARYVLVDEAPRIAERLLEKAGTGAYDRSRTPESLAVALTSDLRAISGDLHFDVQHDPEHAARLLAAGAGTSAALPDLGHTPEELERMRLSNYGFRRVEMLSGNVALIELAMFEDLAVAQPTTTAAMAFVSNADAVIIDIRGNPGGWGNTVGFLVSYFLPGDLELTSMFDRETGETTVSRTLATVPGKRMLEAPLFVLTGPFTGSAAEAFAFTLQLAGRAAIVGQRTVGAAQGGGWVPVGDGFVVFIPSFRSFDPKTGRNWEGSGVLPDVETAVDRALEAAHWRAVAALDAKATRQDLRWLVPLLEFAAKGPAERDVNGMAGRYEGIEISAVGGTLRFLGASGVLRDMVPLSDGTFLIEDSSVPPMHQARVRFIPDGKGAISGLELLTADGDVIPRPRR
jgi:hypothetical protein